VAFVRQAVKDRLIAVAALIRDAEFRAGASAATLSDRVTGSKPGSSHLSFDELPLSEAIERSLDRWLQAWRAQAEQGRTIAKGDRTSAASKARTRAILGERGMDPVSVAFIYGTTERAVQQMRGRNGFDPETGLPERELRQERIDGKASKAAPLTAPARAAMDDIDKRAGRR
jgi:hypothetical protein